MTTPLDRAAQLDLVARLKSSYPELPEAPTPDLIDHERFTAYVKTPHDVGGEPDAPIEFENKQYEMWEHSRRIVRWPRQVLAEFGLYLPEEVEIRVEDSNQKHRFMVMPVRPEGTDGWTEDQLVEIITRDCLIGVALPKVGVTTNVITQTRPAIHPVEQ